MAITTKHTNEYVSSPRILLYGGPGDGKTTLAATLETPKQKDIYFGVTEGGIQSIAHRSLHYCDVDSVGRMDELVAMFRAGKPDGRGGIEVNGHLYRGLVIDLYSEVVYMMMIDLIRTSPRAAGLLASGKKVEEIIDDPSQYEYKKLNFKILRKIKSLCLLPLKYIVMTAYVREFKDIEGKTISSIPKFIGNEIHQAVSARMDYVFRVSTPVNAKEGTDKRVVRTRPSAIHYAKARVPGGAIVLPELIDFKLGDETLLAKIFDRVDSAIQGRRVVEVPVVNEDITAVTSDNDEPSQGEEQKNV